MVWTKEDFAADFIKQADTLESYTKAPIEQLPDADKFAIVGGGPKGFYALRNLLQSLAKERLVKPVQIDWFNEDKYYACGKNFNIHQADFMLINNCIGHVDIRQDTWKMDFCAWISKYNIHRKVASPLDFSSRALVGHYLTQALLHTLVEIPSGIQLNFITEKIQQVYVDTNQGIYLSNNFYGVYKSLLIASGHCYENNLPAALAQDIEQLAGYYIAKPYPIEQLKILPNDADVAVMGLGLTFTDVALGLTEGRGGRFVREGKGYPQYIAGEEEIGTIYAFSRTNLPMLCRPGIFGNQRHSLVYINEESMPKRKAKIKFKSQVLPLLEKEITYAFYRTKWRKEGLSQKNIEKRILQIKQPFGLVDLLDPQQWAPFAKYKTQQDFMIAYLSYTIKEAKKGLLKSPFMAAASVWREASSYISNCYNFEGLSGKSHQQFDELWAGAFNRISFGPPIENMEKILSLCKLGKILFPFCESPNIRIHKQQLQLSTADYKVRVPHLIDARIGKVSLQEPLLASLLQGSIAEELQNESYQAGCLAIYKSGQLKSAKHVSIFMYGTPTEGNTFDNDTLSPSKYNFSYNWIAHLLSNHLSSSIQYVS